MNEKQLSLRVLILITTPKLSEKAIALFTKGNVPIQYQWNAIGTASSKMMDILGLGSPDKSILLSVMPKPFADIMLRKLKNDLKMEKINSGIAFTLPLSGVNNLLVRMLQNLEEYSDALPARKDENIMTEIKYALIVAIINPGFSEEAMDAAREAGAQGGTIVHSRRIGNQEAMSFWGMSIQEEKEMLFIVTPKENKLTIMQSISEKFGIHSEAKGIVLSLPIDSVIGMNE